MCNFRIEGETTFSAVDKVTLNGVIDFRSRLIRVLKRRCSLSFSKLSDC